MAKIVVFGVGQLAEVVSVYLECETGHEIVGYTADPGYCPPDMRFRGKPVVAWDALEATFPADQVLLFGPISYRQGNRFRRDRFLEGKARGYSFLTFIHPATHIYTDKIGENCLILEGNVVQPFAEIGDNVILWSGNHIGHHSIIGDHCFLTSQVGIAGNTTVGELTFFGGQSGVIDNKTIGRGAIIGAGSTVLENVADNSFVMFRGTATKENISERFATRILG